MPSAEAWRRSVEPCVDDVGGHQLGARDERRVGLGRAEEERGLPDVGVDVGVDIDQPQSGVGQQPRHVTHHAGLRHDGGSDRVLHLRCDVVIAVAEGPRRVVAVEGGKGATDAKDARRLVRGPCADR